MYGSSWVQFPLETRIFLSYDCDKLNIFSIFPNIISFLTGDITLVMSLGLCRRLNFNEQTMSVSACETRGYPTGFRVGVCDTEK